MSNGAKIAALTKFKSSAPNLMRQSPTRLLVVYDVVVKTPDVPQVPLIINYGTRPNLSTLVCGTDVFGTCQISQRPSKNMPIGTCTSGAF